MNKVIGLTSIVIILAITSMIGTPAVMANKHHNHLTDTQREDSTASDAQGRPCTYGSDHDQCLVQFQQSQSKSCTFGPNHDECFKEAWDNDS